MCGVALAAPVQWDSSAGGNGHYYDLAYYDCDWVNCRDQAAATTLDYNGTTYYGHLVTITSQAEQDFLANTFMLPYGPRVWIGAYRVGSEFAWVTGEPWSYTNWHSGEPNNASGNENYVEMWGAYVGGWNDNYSPNYYDYLNSYIIEWDTPSIQEVDIDIKPGSMENPVNPGENGQLPVSILGSSSFDVTQIDASSIQLGSVALSTRGKAEKLAYSFEDVNGDGFMDMMTFFGVPDLALTSSETELTMTAVLSDGTSISGSDTITIVP